MLASSVVSARWQMWACSSHREHGLAAEWAVGIVLVTPLPAMGPLLHQKASIAMLTWKFVVKTDNIDKGSAVPGRRAWDSNMLCDHLVIVNTKPRGGALQMGDQGSSQHWGGSACPESEKE